MHSLETEAQHIADLTANQAYLLATGSQQVGKVFHDVQSGPMNSPDIGEKWAIVPAGVCGGRGPTGKPHGCARTAVMLVQHVRGGS